MREAVLAVCYVICLLVVVQEWLLPMRNKIDNLNKRIDKLNNRIDKMEAEIRKIKGQFIWNDESEDEE